MSPCSLIALAILGLAASACTLAPKYTRPAAPVPNAWPTGASSARVGNASADIPPLQWQEFFTDANLRQLISLALTNNRDVRVAALNVERARALYGVRRSELFPTVDASASAGRQRLAADFSGDGEPRTFSRYDVNLGVAAWEIDFFGRIRSFKDRALQEYLATDQARRAAQVLLVSSVAQAYLALSADRESLQLTEISLKTRQDSYALIKKRFDLGLIPELDLARAQTLVDAARGEVAQFKRLVAQDRNALDLLLGTSMPARLAPPTLAAIQPPEELAFPGLPSEVLLNRPDVLQSEHLLKAAQADIGAARAAFFPRISLTAAIGTASSELSGLFQSAAGTWSYAPQIVMPIFDARTWSAHRAAKVQREMAVAEYERSIQNAFREVSDALAVRGTIDEQLRAQESLVNAVSETYRLSNARYERGIDDYLPVLDAQRSLHAAEQALVSTRLAKLSNQVRLYQVLGGF